MSTSSRTIALEAGAGAALATAAVVALSPDDPWLTGVGLHPAWLAVLVPAARYGIRGLALALIATGAALAVVGALLDGSLAGLAARATGSSALLALTAAILIAWIAVLHEGRHARLARRLADAERAAREAEGVVAVQHETLARLRARHDRIDVSIAFWRELAARLHRGDEADAATAAVELAAIRCGADAGAVLAVQRPRAVARWGAPPAEPLRRDAWRDRTARAAAERRRAVVATEVDGADADDSDVAVPIIDDARGGEPLGVLALRGLGPDRIGAPELRDLIVVAGWLAPAMARPAPVDRAGATVEAVSP